MEAIENGVSQFPKLEGRFPQVSGISFKFDPNKPSGHWINIADVLIGDEPLESDQVRQYKSCVNLTLQPCFLGIQVSYQELLTPG